MKRSQLLIANTLAAIFACNFVLGETHAVFIITTSLVACGVTATGSVCLTSVFLPEATRVTLRGTLRFIFVLASVSALTIALPVVLIAFGTTALGKSEALGPNYIGAAFVGSIAGALAGAIASWLRKGEGSVGAVHLVRSLDRRAGAVGAALALAFALGPSGTYAVNLTGIVIGVFTGMLTAAITSRVTGIFGGSLAGALKCAVSATVASAFGFLLGIYLAILAGSLFLLTSGLGHVMTSSTIPGTLSRALIIFEYGALFLIAGLGIMTASSITTVVANARAGRLILLVGFVYVVLGYILGKLAFPNPHDANFEGAVAGGLAGILAGACVGLESKAFKGVTAGLVGGCLAGILGDAIAPVSIRAFNRIVGGVFGGLGGVAGQLHPGVLGAVFGGVLGGIFVSTFDKKLGEVWGEISAGVLSGVLGFILILATEIVLLSALRLALRAVTAPLL